MPDGAFPVLDARRLSVTSIGNLQTASQFALDHDFAVRLAQLDLSNVTAS